MTTTTHSRTQGNPYVVQRLGPADRARITAHLLALDDNDRSLRFGTAADAATVARYVDGIEFDRGAVLAAVTTDNTLAGLAHVALGGGVAELGLSVLADHRRRGVARALTAAALREAERRRANEFRIHFAATNRAMRRVAAELRMELVTEGSDVTARRQLHGTERAPRVALQEPVAVAA